MRVNCRTKYLPSEGKWEIAGTSECRFTTHVAAATGDTRRCCRIFVFYYPYRTGDTRRCCLARSKRVGPIG